MNKEDNEALGQLQETSRRLLEARASKQSLGQVIRLETSCISEQIQWLIPKPPSLISKEDAAKQQRKSSVGMAAKLGMARRCTVLGGKNEVGLL